MDIKNKKYIIIALSIPIIIVIALVLLYFSGRNTPKQTGGPIPTPGVEISEEPTHPFSPPIPTEQAVLLKRFENRVPLSERDTKAVEKILSPIPSGEISGMLYESTSIRLDYVGSADVFQVEILTTEV